MSRFAWLTPDAPPDGEITIALTIPHGDEWETMVRGALAALGEADNYQTFGSVKPEECAQLFRDALITTFQWDECP